MELKLHLLTNYEYDTSSRSFPVVLQINASAVTKIASKVDVIEMSLEHSRIDFGVSRHSSGKMGPVRGEIEIGPNTPYFLLKDMMEYEDEFLKGGEYKLTVRLLVHEATEDGFGPRELSASNLVSINGSAIP